jgi:hypothetical protein
MIRSVVASASSRAARISSGSRNGPVNPMNSA